MSEVTRTGGCIKGALWVSLIVLVVLFLALFTISTLFDLGVWDEFLKMIGQKQALLLAGSPQPVGAC